MLLHTLIKAFRQAFAKVYTHFEQVLILFLLYVVPSLVGVYVYGQSFPLGRRALYVFQVAIIILFYISLPHLLRSKGLSLAKRLRGQAKLIRQMAVHFLGLAVIFGVIAANSPDNASEGLQNVANIYGVLRLLWQAYLTQLLFMTLTVSTFRGESMLNGLAKSFAFGAKNPIATMAFAIIATLINMTSGLSGMYPVTSPEYIISRVVSATLLVILVAAIVEYIDLTAARLLAPQKSLSEKVKDAIDHRKEAGEQLPPPASSWPRLAVSFLELGILYLLIIYVYLFGLHIMGAKLATFNLENMLRVASDAVTVLLAVMSAASLLSWPIAISPLMMAFGWVRIDNVSGHIPSWRKNLLIGILKTVSFAVCLLILIALSLATPYVMNALGTKWVPVLVAYDYLGFMLVAATGVYILFFVKGERGLIDILSDTRVVPLFKPYAWPYRALYVVILVGLIISIVPYMKWVSTYPVPVAQLMMPSLFTQYKTFRSSKGWSVSYNPLTTSIYSVGDSETINIAVGNCTSLVHVRVFWPSDRLKIDRASARKFTVSGYDAWDLYIPPNEKAPYLTYTDIVVDVGEKVLDFFAMSSAFDTENNKFMPKSECILADREVRRVIDTFRYEKP